MSKLNILLVLLFMFIFSGLKAQLTEDSVYMDPLWVSDNGDGTYTNPILHADYSDPDIVKVEDDFYMVSSSFNCVPGLPVLHSKDLVNWEIIGHVFDTLLPDTVYDEPGHGVGVWAPSIRYHKDTFFVYYADPDHGLHVGKATNPAGPWDYKLVYGSYGWIDPCPFWDDDGEAYLVHAYAKSRIGFNSILTLRKLSPDGETIYPEDSVMIFDGNDPAHPRPTLEGSKMYKRNGYYYIFAPFGGVANGSQAVFRSESIVGPYQDSTILEQGSTDINGPHQGGWVELESGESWFVHFQEKQPYGRIVHLQPMRWENDWPVMGEDYDGNGIGEPVSAYSKPNVGGDYPMTFIPSSDKFNEPDLGLQWQWHANFKNDWYSLSEEPGNLVLKADAVNEGYTNLWTMGSLLLQKPASEDFIVTTKVDLNLNEGEYAGLLAMGITYFYIKVLQTDSGIVLSQIRGTSADTGREEDEVNGSSVKVNDSTLYLRMYFKNKGKTAFSYSIDGKNFTRIGSEYLASEGKWIGAKFGVFCHKPYEFEDRESGSASFDWLSVSPLFTAPPEAPELVQPQLDEMVEAGKRLRMEWLGDVLADTFYLYLGTHPDSLELVKTQTSDTYYYRGSDEGKTYYWRVDSKNIIGSRTGDVWFFRTTWPDNIEELSYSNISIIGPYPNPMKKFARIDFEVSKPMNVSVAIIDLSGKELARYDLNELGLGSHTFDIQKANLNAGIYIINIKAGEHNETKRLEVL